MQSYKHHNDCHDTKSVLFVQTSLPALDNPLSVRVRGIIEHIRAQRKHYLKVLVKLALENHWVL